MAAADTTDTIQVRGQELVVLERIEIDRFTASKGSARRVEALLVQGAQGRVSVRIALVDEDGAPITDIVIKMGGAAFENLVGALESFRPRLARLGAVGRPARRIGGHASAAQAAPEAPGVADARLPPPPGQLVRPSLRRGGGRP